MTTEDIHSYSGKSAVKPNRERNIEEEARRALCNELQQNVVVADREWHLHSHKNTFIGSDAVDFFEKRFGVSREQAVREGQKLLDAGYFKNAVDPNKPFVDGHNFYRFYRVHSDDEIMDEVSDQWVQHTLEFLDVDKWNPAWVHEKDVHKPGMDAKVFMRTIPGNPLKVLKAIIRTDATLESLDQLLHDQMVERHGEWSDTYIGGKYLYRLNEDVNLMWWQYNPGVFITNRDFVVARRRVCIGDHTIILLDKGIETGLMPPLPDTIRTEMPFQVRHMTKMREANGTNFVEIQYMNQTDIKGMMPTALVNKSNVSISLEEWRRICEVCTGRAKAS